MRVPGAMASVAGVSLVSVLPSHRRRGILSALMRRQLADLGEQARRWPRCSGPRAPSTGGTVTGAPPGRPPTGCAAGKARWRPGAPADPGLRLRIAEPASARAELAKVFELALAGRPGMYARTEPWWDRLLFDLDPGGTPRPIRCLLAEDDSGPRGYALYTSTGRWDEDGFLPDGVLEVSESIATDPRQPRPSGATCSAGTWSTSSTPGCGRWMTRCCTCWPIPAGSGP